jgi:hypothetical protein
MMRYLSAAVALCALGCGPSFRAATPPNFVELDDKYDDFDYRATTADGLIIGIRELKHEPQGQEAFWLQAIQDRVRDNGGYALTGKAEVKSGDGVKGTQLRFGHDEDDGKPYLYYLTLFVTPKRLVIVEMGGSKKQFEDHAQELDKALSSLTLN